jgi:hypothetical protein
MAYLANHIRKAVAISVALVSVILLALWLTFRKRPTLDELERERRVFLTRMDRLVDSMLLDICVMAAVGGHRRCAVRRSRSWNGMSNALSRQFSTLKPWEHGLITGRNPTPDATWNIEPAIHFRTPQAQSAFRVRYPQSGAVGGNVPP